jgi:hypothetical protein
MAGPPDGTTRKLIAFDPETWHTLQVLARDSMKSLQELADEAFGDLLRKHGRPATLKEALRESARRVPANDLARSETAPPTSVARAERSARPKPRKGRGRR